MGSSDLTSVPDGLILPLSISQREVWLDQNAWPDSPHLNIGGALDLFGEIDPHILQRAINAMVEENEALRLAPLPDGTQKLYKEYRATLTQVDLSQAPEPSEAMRTWERNWIKEPFKFDGTPPWRFALLKGGNAHYYIVIQFHHSIMDGWGTSMIASRLSEHYNAIAEGRLPQTLTAPSYRSFIDESLEYRSSQGYVRDGEYWLGQIKAVPTPLFERRYRFLSAYELPDAFVARQRISRAEYDALNHVAAEDGTTAFHWFLAAVAIYFSRVHGRAELIIGVPSLNRSGKRYKSTMGMFVGVMPILIKVDPTRSLSELITSIALQLRGAYRHPRYPISDIGRALSTIRYGRDSLFDVLVSYERQDYSCSFGCVEGTGSHQTFSGKARYPLGLTICEFSQSEDVELVIEGNSVYFSVSEIELLCGRLSHLLSAMRSEPKCVIASLPIMPPEETWGVINGTQVDTASHGTPLPFIRLFEHHAKLSPSAIGLVWQDGSLGWHDNKMTYGELDYRANQLANQLDLAVVKRGDIVALAVARGPLMAIGVIAAAKAGAAFLPIDTEAPIGRIAEILNDCQAVALLVDDASRERFSSLSLPLVHCRLTKYSGVESGSDSISVEISPDDPAYVLFTSGSTGKPKGVMVSHGALSRRLGWIARAWEITEQDRAAQATQLTFDPSLIELLVPLTHGASVALPPPGRLLPESLAGFVLAQDVTMLAFVPSTLQRFLDGLAGRKNSKLRVVCCGGEVLSPELAERFAKETNAQLYNVYGPTEATIFATAWRCGAPRETQALPVGSPLDDTRIYILDGNLNALPYGVSGEVFIGGDALAMGYVNRSELNAECFVDDPFILGKKMYRTGDRGWLDPSGQLHFSGRIDRQVKLRGYRIELGEIENALLSIDGVTLSAAKKVEKEGKQAIHAWVATSRPLSSDYLNRQLSLRLPDYMLPAKYGIQTGLPIKETGKIDYSALPEIVDSAPHGRSRKPSGDLERQLLAIWCEALNLGQDDLNVNDNFFDFGGDSLAAVAILAGIEKTLGIKLALHQIVETPTVAGMAEMLSDQMGLPSLLISLGTTSRDTTLYLAASGHGDLLRFRALAQAMEGACDLHMLQPPGYAENPSLTELANLYADRIEARGDHTVFVAGFSVGGLAALETARQLRQRGFEVTSLFLVDTVLAKLPWFGFVIWDALAWLARRTRIFNYDINGRRLATTLNDVGLYSQVRAMRRYKPDRFDGKTLLVKSSALTHWDRWLFSPWRRIIPHLEEQVMLGMHGTLFEPGKIDTLAQILSDHIRMNYSEG